MISHRLLYLAAFGSALALIAGYVLTGFVLGVGLVAFLGAVELVSLWRRWRWVTPFTFLVFALLNLVVILLQGPPYLNLLSMVCMLIAWDLEHFRQRVERIRQPDTARAIERYHLLHLLPVAAGGALLTTVAFLLHIRLPFASALILSVLSIFGLTQVVTRLAGRYRQPKRPHQDQLS